LHKQRLQHKDLDVVEQDEALPLPRRAAWEVPELLLH
jgi:hypothetical protein